ncbi:hypothetical protein SAY87_026430 [Trapa incisa]|uniref:Uncharacterized protein n=1 Tax=Trapa incisa TaxID=236973 RepID=A0AAN7GQB2_9MYRT|nr:hypothetical protein SAY87_026430 [Trapa incisa]
MLSAAEEPSWPTTSTATTAASAASPMSTRRPAGIDSPLPNMSSHCVAESLLMIAYATERNNNPRSHLVFEGGSREEELISCLEEEAEKKRKDETPPPLQE